jgi:hypothetical protein
MMTIEKFVEDCRAKGIDCTYEGTLKLFTFPGEKLPDCDADVDKVFVREADAVVQYDVVKRNKNNVKQKRTLEFDFLEGVLRVINATKVKKEFVFAEIKDVIRDEIDPRHVTVRLGPPEHLPVDQQVNWKIQRPYNLACGSTAQANEIVEELARVRLCTRGRGVNVCCIRFVHRSSFLFLGHQTGRPSTTTTNHNNNKNTNATTNTATSHHQHRHHWRRRRRCCRYPHELQREPPEILSDERACSASHRVAWTLELPVHATLAQRGTGKTAGTVPYA